MSKRNEKPISLPYKKCNTCRYNYGHYLCQFCAGGTQYEENKEAMIDEKARVNLREITRKKMEQEGWTQTELAFRLGTTKQVVSNYINGRRNLGYELIERLLQVLEICP